MRARTALPCIRAPISAAIPVCAPPPVVVNSAPTFIGSFACAQASPGRAAIPAPGSPIQFAEFIKKEIDTWGEVVRATGTKPGN